MKSKAFLCGKFVFFLLFQVWFFVFAYFFSVSERHKEMKNKKMGKNLISKLKQFYDFQSAFSSFYLNKYKFEILIEIISSLGKDFFEWKLCEFFYLGGLKGGAEMWIWKKINRNWTYSKIFQFFHFPARQIQTRTLSSFLNFII